MLGIEAQYNSLVDGKSAAATQLARANRAMQAARASIGELIMGGDEAANKIAIEDYTVARQGFITYTVVVI